MTFYELNEAYSDLVSAFIDCENDEDVERLAKEIANISSDIEEKAENYAYVLQNMKAAAAELEAKACIFKKEYDRLHNASNSVLKKIDRLKEHLLFGMELSGIKRIRTSIGLFYTQQTTRVDVLDAWKIPEEFATRQPPKIDKTAIQKAFRITGEIPDGCDIVQVEGVRFR